MDEVEGKNMNHQNKRVTKIKSAYVDLYDKEKKSKQKRKEKLIHRYVMVCSVFVIFLGVIVSYHFSQRSEYADKEQQYEELMQEYSDLHIQKKNLKEEINLRNDEDYVLDIARTNYFLSKEGELIFQVDDPDERSY